MKCNLKTLVNLAVLIAFIFIAGSTSAQSSCSASGNQTTYGTGNVWRGYVYSGINFNTYKGRVSEGTSSSADFDEDFGGDNVNYSTSNCYVNTENFSVRYKLTKSFTAGTYTVTVGGDDGYRFSVDGGSTWVINEWNDHSYQTTTINITLSGSKNLVLEYYERNVNNRVSISIAEGCAAGENQSAYGAGLWTGYVYSGTNFDTYKGSYSKGSTNNPNFDENFGGDNTTFNTSGCAITTENFSVRYRMTKTLAAGTYIITVGGDDGYRLSLNGGASYVINKWNDQSYGTTTYTAQLNGTYNFVLDFYENSGANRVSFNMAASMLPVKLVSFAGTIFNNKAELVWKCAEATGFSHFIVQKSADGRNFENIGKVDAKSDYAGIQSFSYTDKTVAVNAYYRLAMVDIDGTVEFSSIVSLSSKSNGATKIYPTVVENGNLIVENNSRTQAAKLEVFDMNGRMVFTKQVAGGKQQINLQMNKVAGSYVARIISGNEVLLNQMIIVK